MKKTAKSMVEEAMAAITTYSVDDARALHGRDDVQFIDIRDVRELEREGVIGRLHPEFFSTTGNTSVIPTMRRFAHEMAGELRAAGVDGVILTST